LGDGKLNRDRHEWRGPNPCENARACGGSMTHRLGCGDDYRDCEIGVKYFFRFLESTFSEMDSV
jgi:hypothetical protein